MGCSTLTESILRHQELFASTVGPLRKVTMNYRPNGTSTGQVYVEFQRAEDAGKAYTNYNNRVIDGSEYAWRSRDQ